MELTVRLFTSILASDVVFLLPIISSGHSVFLVGNSLVYGGIRIGIRAIRFIIVLI
jgi:hypothetical protein